MKTAIEKALDNVKGISIEKIEKSKKGDKKDECYPIDTRPRIYFSNADIEGIKNYKAGEKVVIVCECTVENVSNYSRTDGDKGEVKNSFSCDLVVESVADIT
jgi:ribosomal protein L21E